MGGGADRTRHGPDDLAGQDVHRSERHRRRLACLPSSSGCKGMLVIAGPSYTTRLWCIMEIFTYIQMTRGIADRRRADRQGDGARGGPGIVPLLPGRRSASRRATRRRCSASSKVVRRLCTSTRRCRCVLAPSAPAPTPTPWRSPWRAALSLGPGLVYKSVWRRQQTLTSACVKSMRRQSKLESCA